MGDHRPGRGDLRLYQQSRKNGDHYWVFAHVTPDIGAGGEIVGFHSNRRVPRRDVIERLQPLYQRLIKVERDHASSKDGIEASSRLLHEFLATEGKAL